ncbi:hypothetical protein KBZ18_16155 [Synechococcus sp. Cruz-9H2]|uniref:hypothetical protein n=1 Tax=unclassified Synechococcus TaxID=2626047 RepID=UPI0020CBE734|nr:MULTISPECIES: hypothetical protein [unclassified Synechococcus]MCP9821013.1 hypothetical protein [Synechococcus sp. Cruz-9H2]MCP9845246.1 hypothetical protein [Synechococcus sp. Edmonson 11F2]MCP9857417.1 hypothetical protein [Synechococcus sp. Cruz-9C9]MCP9864668.1 hypothetical protein [Synechococcus sp. Cruz-7E5]MCP9871937.1 hypothetical protein [Synechococcus sp. Cruz-7B9]
MSAKLSPELVKMLDVLSENRSEAVRQLLTVGAAALGDHGTVRQRLELNQLVAELREVAAALPPTGTTASGAIWAASPDRLPDEPPPVSVVACPGGVMAHGLGGSLVVEREQLQLIVAADDVLEQKITLPQLMALGGELASALTALATRPARAELTCGLTVERTAEGPLRFGLAGKSITVDALSGWRLAAEVLAFATAQLGQEAELRSDLNRRISEVPSWQ